MDWSQCFCYTYRYHWLWVIFLFCLLLVSVYWWSGASSRQLSKDDQKQRGNLEKVNGFSATLNFRTASSLFVVSFIPFAHLKWTSGRREERKEGLMMQVCRYACMSLIFVNRMSLADSPPLPLILGVFWPSTVVHTNDTITMSIADIECHQSKNLPRPKPISQVHT